MIREAIVDVLRENDQVRNISGLASELEKAVIAAIEKVGLEEFKKTSLFLSNRTK